MALENLTFDQPYEYEVQSNVRVAPLASPQTGLYYEVLYRNFTGDTIYLVGDEGVPQEVPPITDGYNRYNRRCIIQRRGCAGPQMNPESVMGDQLKVEMTLRTWTVQASKLNRGPIYISELNVVVCFKQHLPDVEHPYRRASLRDTQQVLMEQLASDNSNDRSCHFLVNDPLKRIKTLYGDVSGVPLNINVTDFIDADHQEATLSVIIQNGETIVRKEYNIEEMFKEGYLVMKSCPIGVIGLSEEVVNSHKFDKLYTQKDVDQEIARAEATAKRKYEQQIKALEVENDTLKNKNDKLQQDYNVLQNQYNSVTGNIRGSQEITTNAAAYAKSNATASEANMKKYTIIMGIITAISTVVTLIVSFFKGFFSSGTSVKKFC